MMRGLPLRALLGRFLIVLALMLAPLAGSHAAMADCGSVPAAGAPQHDAGMSAHAEHVRSGDVLAGHHGHGDASGSPGTPAKMPCKAGCMSACAVCLWDAAAGVALPAATPEALPAPLASALPPGLSPAPAFDPPRPTA